MAKAKREPSRKYTTTYNFQLFVGMKDIATGKTATMDKVRKLVDYCCRDCMCCLTVTPTEFIYPSPGPWPRRHEKGVIIGLINYPRFPKSLTELLQTMDVTAWYMMKNLNQCHVTYTYEEGTCMLTNLEQIYKVEAIRAKEDKKKKNKK